MSDDNGSVSALASGFQMGMSGLNARRSHQMQLQRLALAQEAAQMRMQQMQQQAQMQEQRMGMQQQGLQIRQQGMDLRNQQAFDKQQQTQSDQSANTALFDSLDQQADPRQTGPFDDQHPPATMGGKLGIDRDAFSQASPQAQKGILGPTLQQQRDLHRLTASGDIKRQAEEMKRSKIHTAIAASSLPDDVKEKLHLKVDGAQGVPMGETLSPQEWQAMPYRQLLGQSAPEVALFADAHVAATGKFPDQIIAQHMRKLDSAANPEKEMRLQADMAHRGWIQSRGEETDARKELADFDEKHKEYLDPPAKPRTVKTGKTLGMGGTDTIDPDWEKYDRIQSERKVLQDAAKAARQKRNDAFKAAQQAKDQALGLSAPPPAARATGQAKQATQQNAPAAPAAPAAASSADAAIDALLKEFESQQGQPVEHAEPEEDLEDDGDDTEPDFDLDDDEDEEF